MPQAINNLGKMSQAVDVNISSPHNHLHDSHFDKEQHDHHNYTYHYNQHHTTHAPHHPHSPAEYSYRASDKCTDSQPPFYRVKSNIET